MNKILVSIKRQKQVFHLFRLCIGVTGPAEFEVSSMTVCYVHKRATVVYICQHKVTDTEEAFYVF